MSKRRKVPFDLHWNVDKYKSNYDSEHWDLCRSFMVTHKTKYPEQKLVHLTEAFYQIGVYGSSYDPKTTRMVSALTVEVLDNFLEIHPGTLRHPFNKSSVIIQEGTPSTQGVVDKPKTSQSASIWDVAVDKSIIVNVLVQSDLSTLLKGFVITYDVRRASTMNDSKVGILEESFKRSKFGPCHWDKETTNNNICPVRLILKWKSSTLAQAEGSDENMLRTRIAQAVLSKIAKFSPGIEAKWSYYRDGRMPDLFERPNPRMSNIFKIMPRSQFKAMAEVTSFIDTFANSDSFAEIIFGMDFSNHEKNQLMEYIEKGWGTRLTYRTLNKMGVKSKAETHICIYQVRTGEELRRWLEQSGGENERYRLVPPGEHRRAGGCDSNVREVSTTVDAPSKEIPSIDLTDDIEIVLDKTTNPIKEVANKNKEDVENDTNKQKGDADKQIKKSDEVPKQEKTVKVDDSVKEEVKKNDEECSADDLEKLLDGFVLFYDAKRNSEIDKDDWFSALCESFKVSKFGPLQVNCEDIRPLRMRCVFKWKDKTLASAEGLTETQAKTAATLQLISKLEPFTYIIQAKEEYFFGGKVPPFFENPDPSKNDVYRVVRRKDLPSYYSIFQTIDVYAKEHSYKELIFGSDFSWELKNEIVVYVKAKGLDYRYFTMNDQKPWSHMALYHAIKPDKLKEHLLKNGGENDKYKLIPPSKAEPISLKTAVAEPQKVPEKPKEKPGPPKAAEKRKQPEKEIPEVEEPEGNKIQIKLKKFKKDKVEYPEDTGGDFPGLILWVGIRKNSTWQRNLFCILMESFKMSKYGELTVEECDENVWGRKEPLRKCVIKATRKVLAVGLGDTKNEAKTSASLQVLRQLRQHCYTIQAKESYFKEGKATPYDFNPDPAKQHVYRLARRNKYKDRASIIKFVDDFSKKVCNEEIIFGDDFTYDEREYVLQHCRQINLGYRLMKCQSVSKGMHTHISIFHQRPPPVIKAALIKAGGENDMYRLIPPGGKVAYQADDSQPDLWPETLDNGKQEDSKPGTNQLNTEKNMVNSSGGLHPLVQATVKVDNVLPKDHLVDKSLSNAKEIEVINSAPRNVGLDKAKKVQQKLNALTDPKPSNINVPIEPQPLDYNVPSLTDLQSLNYNVTYNVLDLQLQSGNYYPYPQQGFPEIPFGPQPLHVPPPPMYLSQPYQEMPLVFGPQPPMIVGNVMPLQPQFTQPTPLTDKVVPPEESVDPVKPNTGKTPVEEDLRDELARKRQADNLRKSTPDRIVYDMSTERKITKKDDDEGWSRKVFVSGPEDKPSGSESQNSKSHDLREKLIKKDLPKGKKVRGVSEERVRRKISPKRDSRRMSPDRKHRRFSPVRDRRRFSPERNHPRDLSRDRFRVREERIVRERAPSYERRVSHEPLNFVLNFRDTRRNMSRDRNEVFRSRSPRRSPYRDELRLHRSLSPTLHFRDLWDNISSRFSQSIFMYKYVKQDSTTETDPFALLRATRSLDFNVDFDFIHHQRSVDEWQVSVELVTDDTKTHPLVGEGFARTEREARLIAAHHAVDTIQKACRVIEPNFGYFADGGVPEFIARKSPIKSAVYEIIQNMDPQKPLDRYTIEVMLTVFLSSQLDDVFFLANDFSYAERVTAIELANQMGLWWRLFGPRHPDARPDDVVSTQHVCVSKQQSTLQLVRCLLANGGSTQRFTLVDPRESRITCPKQTMY